MAEINTYTELLKNQNVLNFMDVLSKMPVENVNDLTTFIVKLSEPRRNKFFNFIHTLNRINAFFLTRFFSYVNDFLGNVVMKYPQHVDDHSH